MEKKLYLIKNSGCDDTTFAVLELTQNEVDYLTKIFETINENSNYSCQPTIHIDKDAKPVKIKDKNDIEDYRFDVVYSNGKYYKY